MLGSPRAVRTARVTLLALFGLLGGCRTGRNYAPATVPRMAVPLPMALDSVARRALPDSLRLVTFNIKYGRRIDEAIRVLTTDPALRNADLVLLQEMDGAGTARIASALGMAHVYCPATFHLRTRRDFGNAILSRWPMVADTRLVLPHHSHTTLTQRTATAATIRVGHRLIRVYSVHLGTLGDIGPGERRDQMEQVIRDAMQHPHVIIGGDMNSAGVGPVARQHGFTWITARNARTTIMGRWDHFFARGFEIIGEAPTGVSASSRAASDHRAVWSVVPMRGRPLRPLHQSRQP